MSYPIINRQLDFLADKALETKRTREFIRKAGLKRREGAVIDIEGGVKTIVEAWIAPTFTPFSYQWKIDLTGCEFLRFTAQSPVLVQCYFSASTSTALNPGDWFTITFPTRDDFEVVGEGLFWTEIPAESRTELRAMVGKSLDNYDEGFPPDEFPEGFSFSVQAY